MIGFDNGVYDLAKGVFRAGTPEDRVSLSCGYDFVLHDDHEVQADITAFVASTQASEEMTTYLWLLMAYLLSGRKYQEMLWFWTGRGRNGKGALTLLLKMALGSLFYAPDASIFMMADKSPSGARPEIMEMRGKRAVIASEPDDATGASFKVCKLKAWRGNDVISARALYQSTVSFEPQFAIIICMNDRPNLDKVDHAISSTLRIIDFPYEFVDVAQLPHGAVLQTHQRQMDSGLKQRFEDVRYRQQFMRMLISLYRANYATLFGAAKHIPTPAAVLAATQEYIDDNNDVGVWLSTYYERTDDVRDRCIFADMMDAYRRDMHVTGKLDRSTFKKAMALNGMHARTLTGRVTYTCIRRRADVS